MKEYVFDPHEGICEAFFLLNPEAEPKDLVNWAANQDRSDSDPRLLLYSLSNLCDQAFAQLVADQETRVDPLLAGTIGGSLAHFETSIRAYNAILGHRRFTKLAQLSPIDALKACLPNEVKSENLI